MDQLAEQLSPLSDASVASPFKSTESTVTSTLTTTSATTTTTTAVQLQNMIQTVETLAASIPNELEANWIDITSDFAKACNDLTRGELCHDEMFGLFEAMSAIEMMDPKMDAGMICNRVHRKVLNFADSIAAGVVKIVDLKNEEKIGIVDDTICCLMSWLDGHTLAQTLFTNLYLHDPNLIQDKFIKSFTLLILSLIDVMRAFVLRAEVFEEEDFQSSLYQYKLDHNYSESKIYSLIKEVEDELNRRMKQLIRTSNNRQTATATKTPSNISTITEDPVIVKEYHQLNGLLSRIRTLKSLLMSLLLIFRETEVNTTSTTSSQSIPGDRNTSSSNSLKQSNHNNNINISMNNDNNSINNNNSHSHHRMQQHQQQSNPNLVHDVCKHLSICSESIAVWRETIVFGITTAKSSSPDHNNSSTTSSSEQNHHHHNDTTPSTTHHHNSPPTDASRADYPTIMGFEPLINQRLLPATFPRYTRLRGREESLHELEILIKRLLHVIQVKDHVINDDFHAALDFLSNFSRFPSGTCVLSRSVLQLTYVPLACTPATRDQFIEMMKSASNKFIRPPALQVLRYFVSTNGSKQTIEGFFVQSLRPMLSLLQIQGHNRARQREKLAQVLDELTAFQCEGEKVDGLLNRITSKMEPAVCHTGFFGTWVLYHVLRVMIQYLVSGFELELYSTHEYPYIYWYLYEFLYAWLISTLTRASNLSIEQQALAEILKAKQSNKKVSKNSRKNRNQQKERPHQRELLMVQALQQLCGGMFKMVFALRSECRLKQPLMLMGDKMGTKMVTTRATAGNDGECGLVNVDLSSEKLRYEHRFHPFANVIAPPAVPYQQFRDMCDQIRLTGHSCPRDLYAGAFQCFDEAKRILTLIPDPSEEITTYLKVAKTNQVVAKLLATGVQTSKFFPDFDFTVSKIFPIVRVM